MRYAHRVTLSVFSKQGEDIDKIRPALQGLALLDLEKEKIRVKDTIAKSHEDQAIHILEITMKKEGQVNRFLKKFIAKLGEDQRQLIVRQRESRVDEECHFFVRFDKRKLLEEDRWWITDGGDCFHIKLTLAAYPVKKDVGMRIVRELFEAPLFQI